MGYSTEARGEACTVIGLFNDPLTSDEAGLNSTSPLFIIGNGEPFFLSGIRSNAMVVLKNGTVGIGTNTPVARLHLKSNSLGNAVNSQLMLEEDGDDYARLTMKNTSAPTMYWDMAAYNNNTSASARLNFYYHGVGDILSVRGDGNATLRGTLTQNSDARLKKDIVSIGNALEKIVQLNGYNYYWKDDNIDASLQTGVMAQEVEKVMPHLVKKDEKGTLSVNYSGLVPLLIQSVKEQQKQMDEKQKQIDELKARLEKLEKLLGK